MNASKKTTKSAPSRRKPTRSARTPLFPPAVHAFAARRVVDSCGLALLTAGLATALSLASYAETDPSLNTAVSADGPVPVQNLLGAPGAYLADLLMQTLGLAGWVFAAVFCVWGYRILRRREMGKWSARIPALLGAVICAALALARVPAFEGWVLGSYLGGSAGTLVFNALGGTLQGIIGDAAHIGLAITAGCAGAGLMLLSLGITRAEWARAGALLAFATATTLRLIARALIGFRNWVAHYAGHDPVELAPATPAREPQLATDEVARPEPEKRSEPVIAVPEKKASLVTPRPKKLKEGKRAEAEKQPTLGLNDHGEWELPPLSLLQEADSSYAANHDETALQRNAEMLQSVLEDFGVKGDIVKVHPGPVVTLYELEPAPGIKTSRVIGLSDDIARSMSAVSVRAAVVPGRNVIGIELPNAQREFVYLRELLSAKAFETTKAHLPLVLGKDIGGQPVIADLARMPHLLVAGTTGSGKSVAVNTMILSLLYRHPPEKCRFIMIDPKMLELSVYDDIPHLLTPVVTDPGKAVVALKWTVREMEERYRAMSKMGVRNIEGYNARLREARDKGEVIMRKVQTGFDPDTGKPVFEEQPQDLTELPYIVVVVDEFADLMLVAGKDVEAAIQRLAQMARAAGIHLMMATQRPSVDVITGTIKANFPTRISFQVTSKIDSRTILGEGGAEHLLGMGDMLYMASGGRIKRVHGPFCSDEEVEHVVTHLKEQGEPQYLEDVTEGDADDFAFPGMPGDGEGSGDELYDQAVHLVLSERKASTSFVQRHLSIGYNRAAKLIDRMEKEGVIGPANHVGKREILVGDMVGG